MQRALVDEEELTLSLPDDPPPPPPVRAIVLGPSGTDREWLASVVAARGNVVVAGTYAQYAEASTGLRNLVGRKSSIVFVDARLQGPDEARSVIRRVRELFPMLRIVVYGRDLDQVELETLYFFGADAVITPHMDKDAVTGAILGSKRSSAEADHGETSGPTIDASQPETRRGAPVRATRDGLFEAVWGSPAPPEDHADATGTRLFEATWGLAPEQGRETAAPMPAPSKETADHNEGPMHAPPPDAEGRPVGRAKRRLRGHRARREDEQHEAILRNLEHLVPTWQDPRDDPGNVDETPFEWPIDNGSGEP